MVDYLKKSTTKKNIKCVAIRNIFFEYLFLVSTFVKQFVCVAGICKYQYRRCCWTEVSCFEKITR